MGTIRLRQKLIILHTVLGLIDFVILGDCRALQRCDDADVNTVVCFKNETYFGFDPPMDWPIEVEVWIEFYKISSLDVNEGTVTASFSIASYWTDQRLTILWPEYYNNNESIWYFPIPEDVAKEIWRPRVEIINEKSEEQVKLGSLEFIHYPRHNVQIQKLGCEKNAT